MNSRFLLFNTYGNDVHELITTTSFILLDVQADGQNNNRTHFSNRIDNFNIIKFKKKGKRRKKDQASNK